MAAHYCYSWFLLPFELCVTETLSVLFVNVCKIRSDEWAFICVSRLCVELRAALTSEVWAQLTEVFSLTVNVRLFSYSPAQSSLRQETQQKYFNALILCLWYQIITNPSCFGREADVVFSLLPPPSVFNKCCFSTSEVPLVALHYLILSWLNVIQKSPSKTSTICFHGYNYSMYIHGWNSLLFGSGKYLSVSKPWQLISVYYLKVHGHHLVVCLRPGPLADDRQIVAIHPVLLVELKKCRRVMYNNKRKGKSSYLTCHSYVYLSKINYELEENVWMQILNLLL